MTGTSEWSIAGARTLSLDETPVEELDIRVVSGTVNVVGTPDPTTRVEVAELSGPPLMVRLSDRRLSVGYDDVPWRGLMRWLDRKGWRRHVVVSVRVPATARLSLGVVGASAVVSGVGGATDVRGINGDVTLVGLSGPVRADTVSGAVEAQSLTGPLKFNSVSGGLTVVDGGPRLRGDSVSGDMVVDLAPSEQPPRLRLSNVSGEIAVRLPEPVNARLRATTASGAVSSGFVELVAQGSWGAKHLAGRLGTGAGSVHCSTVSGPVALLRRPAAFEEEPAVASLKDV